MFRVRLWNNSCVPKIRIFKKDISLIQFANEFGTDIVPPPVPFRRTCSLMRSMDFGSIICEATKLTSEDIYADTFICSTHYCGDRYYSCRKYLSIMKTHYGTEVLQKECYKIAFVKKALDEESQINELHDNDLMAYCILHIDTIDFGGEIRTIPYVTESIIAFPERRQTIFISDKSEWKIKISGMDFIVKGNYFSQQNTITNCCGHAAIKMALRKYSGGITAERINKSLKIDHLNRQINGEGFRTHEFENVIKDITGLTCEAAEIRSFDTPFHFIKLIYHALESKFPVIMLFSNYIANKKNKTLIEGRHVKGKPKKGRDMHAVALIGHTFNRDNWWSYAWKTYFNALDDGFSYLPSVLWCDNFVIQDDNVGPYYLFPVYSLKTSETLSLLPKRIRNMSQRVRFCLSIAAYHCYMRNFARSVYLPVHCIVAYPSRSLVMSDSLWIELSNYEFLENFVEEIKNIDTVRNNLYFREYFIPNYRLNNLVLRTFAVSKNHHLRDIVNNVPEEYRDEVGALLEEELPNYFWVTEVSIRELYWVNFKKIGEIIVSPKKIPSSERHSFKKKNRKGEKSGKGIVFVRLPSIFAFVGDDGKIVHRSYEERDSRYPLIKVKTPV